MCLSVPFLIDAQSIKTIESSDKVEALLSAEWEIYLADNNKIIAELLLSKSKIYSLENDYSAALKTLERVSLNNLDLAVKHEIINEKILLFFLLGQHGQVKNGILETTFLDGYMPNDDIKLIEILNYVALKDLKQAKLLFEKLNPKADPEEVFDVKKLKKREKAYNLSFLIPGSGQMYSGHFFKGFTSLTLQTFLFTYGIKGFQRKYFFTQTVPSIGLFQGFYFGGAEYAMKLVELRNEKILKELSNNIINSF